MTSNLPPWWSCVVVWFNSVPSPSYTLRSDRLAFHLSLRGAYCVGQHMFSKGKGKGKPKRTGDLAYGCTTCGRTQRPCAQLQQEQGPGEVVLVFCPPHEKFTTADAASTDLRYCSYSLKPTRRTWTQSHQSNATSPYQTRSSTSAWLSGEPRLLSYAYIYHRCLQTLRTGCLCSERKQKAVPSYSEACDEHTSCAAHHDDDYI
jgi:hypothetical protein